MAYTVVLLRQDDGGFTVLLPALPGCITEGDTVEECLANAREAIVGIIQCLRAHGEAVPLDDGAVAFQMDGASEALVYRVTIEEAAAVA